MHIWLTALITCALAYTELKDATYTEFLKANQYVLLEAYEPRCTICLEKQLAAAEPQLESHGVKVARIDLFSNPTVAQMFKQSKFPIVRWYKDGLFVKDYSLGRDVSDLVKWGIK